MRRGAHGGEVTGQIWHGSSVGVLDEGKIPNVTGALNYLRANTEFDGRKLSLIGKYIHSRGRTCAGALIF
jgi:hypothetical protein